ncbi:MAG TPA: sigma-70 family RNA polymerase sigma factor [Chitinophagaceae bacterium]|nr:sigma-70 family RNA polymerase sigma factor [Chitinophagaceae bacterium]
MQFVKNISSPLPDPDLLVAYKETGDLSVLGDLYQRYMDLVYGVCLKYLKDEENAKDCVINIFEELITKLQKHEVENFKAWLYQLAKNHCLMRLRSEKKFIKSTIDVDLMQTSQIMHLNGELEKEENFKQLEYCLGTLNNDQRKTVELFYLQSKCYNEIVEITGIEWNAVRSAIQNGKRNLRLCMEKQKLQSHLND